MRTFLDGAETVKEGETDIDLDESQPGLRQLHADEGGREELGELLKNSRETPNTPQSGKIPNLLPESKIT